MKKIADASTLILRGMVGPVILALVLLPVIIFTPFIQGFESNISSEQRQLNQVREDIKAREARIALLESTIKTLESTIKTLESTIETLLEKDVENRQEIQQLQGEIQQLQGEIQRLRNEIGN